MNWPIPKRHDLPPLGRVAVWSEFFRMISLSTVRHPLVSNDNPKVAILGITSEAGFMGDLNSKTIRQSERSQPSL